MNRKIIIENYLGPGKHVYEDELGFRDDMLQEARTLVDREAFRFHIELVGLNLAFYYPKTDTFYGIHTETLPINVKILPRHKEWSEYIGWQCESDTHNEGEIIASFEKVEDIWENLKIDNTPFDEVIRNSYITGIY